MNTDTLHMVPVENCEGSNRFIPSERAILQINTEWLHAKSACDSGVRWFRKTFPNGCNYLELRSALAIGKHNSWESWILNAVGGDTATAGYRGTATAGEEGIIRILEWDEKHSRYRVITGIIGDSGIEANVPYIVVDSKLVRKEEA